MSTRAITPEAVRKEMDLSVLAQAMGFFFAARIFSVVVAVKLLGQDPDAGSILNLVISFLLLMTVMFCVVGNSQRTTGSIVRLAGNRWVLLFLGFSGLSLLWTVAVSVPAAAAFWCSMVADTGMVVLLLRVVPSRR